MRGDGRRWTRPAALALVLLSGCGTPFSWQGDPRTPEVQRPVVWMIRDPASGPELLNGLFVCGQGQPSLDCRISAYDPRTGAALWSVPAWEPSYLLDPDGRRFTVRRKGKIDRYRMEDRRALLEWTVTLDELPEEWSVQFAIADSRLLVAGRRVAVAFDLSSIPPARLWSHAFGSDVSHPDQAMPAAGRLLAQGIVILDDRPGRRLVKLDLDSGKEIWSRHWDSYPDSRSLRLGLFADATHARLVCRDKRWLTLDLKDGAITSELALGDLSEAVQTDAGVIVAQEAGRLLCLRGPGVAWKMDSPPGDPDLRALEVEGELYLWVFDLVDWESRYRLWRLDPGSGRVIWQSALPERLLGVIGEHVWVNVDGHLGTLSRGSGTTYRRRRRGSAIAVFPGPRGSIIIEDGNGLYGFDPASDRVLWRHDTWFGNARVVEFGPGHVLYATHEKASGGGIFGMRFPSRPGGGEVACIRIPYP